MLSLSAGYQVSIEDELEYFDPEASKSWFLATGSNDEKIGFVRCFRQGSDWSLGELYVDEKCQNRRQIAMSLLNSFTSQIKFDSGHRLRFDIRIRDLELNDAIVACGFSQKQQTFIHFEINVTNAVTKPFHSKPLPSQASKIVETLRFLNHVTESDVLEWMKQDAIRIVSLHASVASAAHVSESEDAIEIVRIATHANFLRRGCASSLISEILQEAFEKKKLRVYLKVEDIRAPAISTYIKSGFKENDLKSQIWHSRWY